MSKIIDEDDFNKIIKNLRAEGIEPFPFITPDFNFSAKFYAMWLRWLFANIEAMQVIINQLLKREIGTKETASINLTQDGDWTTEFLVTLQAVLKLSEHKDVVTLPTSDGGTKDFTIENALKIFEDGVYTPDYKSILDYFNNSINIIINSFGKGGDIEVPRVIFEGKSKLVTPIDLPGVNDNTKVRIDYQMGSTHSSTDFKVSELKGIDAHITGINHNDIANEAALVESATHINSNNQLQVNWCKCILLLNSGNKFLTTSLTDATPYQNDTQFPDFVKQINGQDQSIDIVRITVYDIVHIGG